jgi:DNA recombination protein RmuC
MLYTILLLTLILLLALFSVAFQYRIWKQSQETAQGQGTLDIEKSIAHSEKSLQDSLKDEFQRNRLEVGESIQGNRKELSESLGQFEQRFSGNMVQLKDGVARQFKDFGQQQRDISHKSQQMIQQVTESIHKQLGHIREDNAKQLHEMRETVDEKLQNTLEKRIGESFKIVNERLEAVHKGLGEMQSLASDVGGLKKVLSNVKTRGILGEYQLENILEQILAPHQYAKNVATKKGSQAHVEFAVKFPGQSLEEEVWLPIDSKFPIESYQLLLDAYEDADKEQVELFKKKLFTSIETFAKDICDKYIDPPHTTDFGILFLPIEGLYAEVIRNTELFEKLQRQYKITLVGPTTLATILNSFKMGFNTLVMNKKSSEVWKVLEGVKSEFQKFGGILEKVDKQLTTASNTLGSLKTTRVNAIERKLRDVTLIDEMSSEKKPLNDGLDLFGKDDK